MGEALRAGEDMTVDGQLLGAIGTIGLALVAFLTYFVTKARLRTEKAEARSGLVADALAIQTAAQTAYENAKKEADLARAEFAELRVEIADIKEELGHWREVAEAGHEEARRAGINTDWFRPFIPKEA